MSCKKHRWSSVEDQLHEAWDNFFANADQNATFLQIGFSEGVTNIRNALMSYDEDLRKRIDVLAYGPSAYIERRYCNQITHYCSENDPIPKMVGEGFFGKENVVMLKPHPNASKFDHNSMSPTYEQPLRIDINNYLNK